VTNVFDLLAFAASSKIPFSILFGNPLKIMTGKFCSFAE